MNDLQSETTRSAVKARLFPNPLSVYAAILVGGDCPLLIAYGMARDPVERHWLMVGLILFVFLMGATFCGLTVFRTRRLFAPAEFQPNQLGRSIYDDTTSVND